MFKEAADHDSVASHFDANHDEREYMKGDSRMSKGLKANSLKTKTIEEPISAPAKVTDVLKLDALKTATIGKPLSENETRPKNLKSNLIPSDGYGLEVDGRLKSHFDTAEVATRAGLELKKKYPQIQVKIFDAKARTRVTVELPV